MTRIARVALALVLLGLLWPVGVASGQLDAPSAPSVDRLIARGTPTPGGTSTAYAAKFGSVRGTMMQMGTLDLSTLTERPGLLAFRMDISAQSTPTSLGTGWLHWNSYGQSGESFFDAAVTCVSTDPAAGTALLTGTFGNSYYAPTGASVAGWGLRMELTASTVRFEGLAPGRPVEPCSAINPQGLVFGPFATKGPSLVIE